VKVWCAIPEDGRGWTARVGYVPALADADDLAVGYVKKDNANGAWSSFEIGSITALTVVRELPGLQGIRRHVYGVMRPGDAERKRLGAFGAKTKQELMLKLAAEGYTE